MTAEPSPGDRMAATRTDLAFQRTRIASERTLMAIMRTSLSLIGFGFTIFSFFHTLGSEKHLGSFIPDRAPGRFGFALVLLGVLLLVFGIISDKRQMDMLKRQREQLIELGLTSGLESFPPSLTRVASITLLFVGLSAILIIALRM